MNLSIRANLRASASGRPILPARRKGVFRYSLWRGITFGFGILTLLGLMVAGTMAPWLSPHDPLQQNVRLKLLPPVWMEGGSLDHVLGTDQLGRDVLSRLIHGARIALLVGFFSVLLGGLTGLVAGLVSGYFGGALDAIIMGGADAQLAFPFILLALAVLVALGPGLTNVIIVLSIDGWAWFARLVRAITLSIKEKEFVEAARASGASSSRIMYVHMLPHLLSPVIVLASLQLGYLLLAEAALSFLGMGVNPPTPTWGNMVSDGQNYLWDAPWLSVIPGIVLVLTVLGLTFLGDWLRERLDPRSGPIQR